MPRDFTYAWNLKTNEQAEQKQTPGYREHFDGSGLAGVGKKGEGIKKYKCVVIE